MSNIQDITEDHRRVHQRLANNLTDSQIPDPRWTPEELSRDFEVLGFLAPYVCVIRKSDGVKGSLAFRHAPRIYFGFEASHE